MSSSEMEDYPTSYVDANRGHVLVGVCAFLITVETILIALRFYTRYIAHTPLGWDDAFLPVAWLSNLGLNVVCINAVYNAGVGRHWDVVVSEDPHTAVAWVKSILAVDYLYLISDALPKFSIICLYLRIFIDRRTRAVCYFLIAFTIATWLSFTVAVSVQCIPVRYQWDKTIPGHCFDVESFYESTSVPNIFSDVIVMILPLPTILNLHASTYRKVGLVVVFMTGSMGLVGSCARMATFFKTRAFVDNTWSSVDLMAWTCVEPGMYLIAACLVALGPLVSKLPGGATRFSRGAFTHDDMEKSRVSRAFSKRFSRMPSPTT